MNDTKIEWTDKTVNPVVGCPHGCVYCYARQQAKRQLHRCKLCYTFKVHPHLERLEKITPRQKPKKIFIDSMWDWNAVGVEEDWIHEIIEKMNECKQHTFQILSKRPIRYRRFTYPKNVWIGTSITGKGDLYCILDLLYTPGDNIKFVSIEPIHEKINFWFGGKTGLHPDIDWIIVGAETGRRKDKIIPKPEWIQALIDNARTVGIPIFIKDNVCWPETIQEFPSSSPTLTEGEQ